MAKIIERPDFQTAFENIVRVWQKQNMRCETDINELIGRMRSLVERAEWETVNRWISVEDALPEIGYSVLVTRQTESNTRYIRIASRQDDCWMDNTDKYGKPNSHPVIAWMPIPDAYEPPESEVQEDADM